MHVWILLCESLKMTYFDCISTRSRDVDFGCNDRTQAHYGGCIFLKMITEFTPEPAKKKLDNKGHACGESSMI